jgi:predicted RND superfamily exporter protein
VQSIADLIATGAMTLQGAQLFGVEMQNTSANLVLMNENLLLIAGGLETIDPDNPYSVGATLEMTEAALNAMVQALNDMAGGDPPANGNGGYPNLTMIRMIIEAMDDTTVKGTITSINTFDPTPLNEAVDDVVEQRSDAEENVAVEENAPIGGPLTAMLMDSDFMNGTYYNASGVEVDHTLLIEGSLESLYILDAALGMLTGFEATPEVMANILFGIALGLQFILSTDYDPMVPAPEAKASLMIVQQNGSADSDVILQAQYDLEEMASEVEKVNKDDIEFRLMAGEILFDKINSSSMQSLGTLLVLAILIIIVILSLVYRSLVDTALTLVALLMVIVWTFGLGVILGFTFNPMTIAVPVLLVGLSVDYGIHLTMRYRIEKRTNSLQRSTIITIASVGMALLLATITTVFSFMSNMLSDLSMMREFGMLAAMGIMSAFIVMNTFVPAARLLLDQRRERKGLRKGSSREGANGPHREKALVRFVQIGATSATKYSTPIVVIAILLSAVSFYSLTEIDTEFDFMDFLPDELEETQTINYLFDNFNFSSSSSNVLTEGVVANGTFLKAIYASERNMDDARDVVKKGERADTRSPVTTIMKYVDPTSPVYDANLDAVYQTTDPDANGIPTENVPELFNAFYAHPSAAGDIAGVVHINDKGEYDAAIISVSVHEPSDGGELLAHDLNDAIEPLTKLKDKDKLDEAIVTDGPVLTYLTISAMNAAGLKSVLATVIMAMVLLIVTYYAFYRTWMVGLLSTIPIMLVIGWVYGSMYLLNIPLNVVTIMISALTIGLGITFAIHISHRFLEDLQTKPWKTALCDTVGHTGAALFGAAATTIGGFGILTFSVLPPMAQFGIVTALSIFYSFLASVFVLPSFLAIWARRKYGEDGGRICAIDDDDDEAPETEGSPEDGPDIPEGDTPEEPSD